MDTKSHCKLLMDGVRTRLREFRGANGANVSITFALATVPMIGFVGAAVDYGHANSVRTAMQAAADTTALMLAKNAATLSSSELQAKGNEIFKALFNRPDAKGLVLNVNYTTTSGPQVTVNASADVKTDFMQLMGFQNLKIGVDSQARWGNARLRVSLVLDNTGSMADSGKMDALKTATKGLLTQLKNAAAHKDDVYVSIIPFSKDVNIGKQFSLNSGLLRLDIAAAAYGLGGLSNASLWNIPNILGILNSSWNGCVADRDKPHDTTNAVPTASLLSTLFPVEQYDDCPVELMPLSNDWNKLESKVDSMKPVGMTNQTIGLQWGFQSLTAAPFTIPAKNSNYQYTEVIILLTDGLNTENRFGDDTATMDSRTQAACTNAKAAGITVYAVQVNTGGDPTQNFLKTCASSPDKFVELKSASQMVATFNTIGTNLTKLRIAQ
jgi:Flp pilus assembly protein TadG